MADDRTLLPALKNRDSKSFAELFERYSDKLYRVAFGILNDESDAEGVVQDTFLKLIENLDDFEARSTLGTWLYRVAYNASLDRLRRKRPHAPLADDFQDDDSYMPAIFLDWTHAPETHFSAAEKNRVLAEAISQLPLKLQSTFILREIDGLSTAETATVLNTSPGAVKVQLHRARLQLRELLSAYFQERTTP